MSCSFRNPNWASLSVALLLCMIAVLVTRANGLTVISIDIGNDFYKVAIVKPGVPMEIVLNSESKRKTPTVVTLKSDERLFGDAAINAGIRKPLNMFTHFVDLIGKNIDHSSVKNYKTRFPHHNIVPTDRDTVQFKVNENTFYTVEELLAMIFNNSRNMAIDFIGGGEVINNAIITIPAYFNQAERRAFKNAAEISGLKLLQLMSDNAAVALNYGIFRHTEFKEAPMYMMFFDMGSSATKATVVEYKTDKITENGRTETHPHLFVRGFGYDRSLGGSEFDFRLRKYLAEEFTKHKKTSVPIYESPKAMMKLLKEANRVKQVLSANIEHYAQVEGLHEEQDFKCLVTREVMEELCSDLYDRVKKPIEMALQMADLTLENIESFIVFGGSFRVPKIQDKLIEFLDGKKEISKNINADEAAALGAVYQAAFLSSAFRVKRFVVKDASVFPVDVSFDRLYVDENDGSEKLKSVDRTIFNKMNTFPVKKAMTFNRMYEDFSFLMKYSNLDFLSSTEFANFGKTHLANVAVSGVKDSYLKNMALENVTDKGVKAHFRLDESGLIEILGIEYHYERKILEEVKKEPEVEKSTIEKLSDSISSFFSSKPSGAAKQDEKNNEEEQKEEYSEDVKDNSTTAENGNNTSDSSQDNSSANSSDKNAFESSNDTKAAKEPVEVKIEEKLVTSKDPLQYEIEIKDSIVMSESAIKESKEKLVKLSLRDFEKLETAKALNDLESFIIGQQDKLSSNEVFLKVSTEAERDGLIQKLSAASDWLYDDGIGLTSVEYKSKLGELRAEMKDVMTRVREMNERPKVFEQSLDVINRTSTFLNITKSMPEEYQIFTPVELETLSKALNETILYVNESVKTLAESDPTQTAPILVSDMKVKIASLERELGYLLNKMRYATPKPKPTTPPTSKPSSETTPDVEVDMEPEGENATEPDAESSGEKTSDAKDQEPSTEEPVVLELPGAKDDSLSGESDNAESTTTTESPTKSKDSETPNPEL